MEKNKIGNYIHYHWNNYLKYGTLIKKSKEYQAGVGIQNAREAIVNQQLLATKKIQETFKQNINTPSQEELNKFCDITNSLITLKPNLAQAQANGIIEAASITQEEINKYVNRLKDLLSYSVNSNLRDIDITETGNIFANAVDSAEAQIKKYSRSGEYFVKFQTIVNYYNNCIQGFMNAVQKEEISKKDLAKINEQLNKLDEAYIKLYKEAENISQISFESGKIKNYKNIIAINNNNEEILKNFGDAIREIKKILTVTENVSNLKGIHFENILGIAGIMLGGIQIDQAIDKICQDLTTKGGVYISGKKQTDASLNLSNIAFDLTAGNLSAKASAKSQQKIDVNFTFKNKEYNISAKNYNPYFPGFEGISLVNGSSLLTILSEENSYINFTNHYLNLASKHENNSIVTHNLSNQLNKALSLTILYFALAGKRADRNTKVPNILMVHNNSDGTTSAYTFKTISDKLIQNLYRGHGSYLTINTSSQEAALNDLHFQNNFNGIGASYNEAKKRIANLLSEVHKTKINVYINSDFSKKLLAAKS